jgi:hypothetical protein
MIEDLPGEKIPEVYQAREGKSSLKERLKNVDAVTVRGYVPVNKDGDTVDGPLMLDGGATIPEGDVLRVEGNLILTKSVVQIGQIETTGNFGVATVVADVSEYLVNQTDLINVIDFTPTTTGNFFLYVYIRIKDTPSMVNILLNYEDCGGYKQQRLVDNEQFVTGSYNLPPVYISSKGGSPIFISVQCNNPNQLYFSASIIGL